MDPLVQIALQLAFNYSLEMVAWSAGLIAFSAGFLSEPAQKSRVQRVTLYLMFAIYMISIIAGIICLSAIIGHLTDVQILEPAASGVGQIPPIARSAASVQFAFFFLGTCILVFLAVFKMRSGPTTSADDVPARSEGDGARRTSHHVVGS